MQKIRLLNAIAKLSKEIFEMVQKNLVHLGLTKKESNKLWANLDKYIKAVSFTIYPYKVQPAKF